jgi:hypothetical protein
MQTDALTDAEGEAVLLALGSSLTWRMVEAKQQRGLCAEGDNDDIYCVQAVETTGRKPTTYYQARILLTPLACRTKFKTESAAKAACEHHHDTGNWP